MDLGSLQQDWLWFDGGNQSLKGFPSGILMVCRVFAHCSRHMYKNAASNQTYKKIYPSHTLQEHQKTTENNAVIIQKLTLVD